MSTQVSEALIKAINALHDMFKHSSFELAQGGHNYHGHRYIFDESVTHKAIIALRDAGLNIRDAAEKYHEPVNVLAGGPRD